MQKHYTIFTVLLIGLLSMMSLTSLAQVTTSSMRGTVSDDHETLAAATVRVTHTPSGTTYNALTDAEGRFFINNMRVGGPYTVKVTFIGYRDHITEGITLQLGQTFVLDVRLSEDSELLEGVTVTAESKNSVFNSQRTGALTSVSPEQLKQLPTITRSLSDFTRLTPQANGGSFAGRDGRMNNVTIDGGAFRNNFGLSSNMMPGGTAQPISLDAIEEVSVNIAPFDIRLSNFTGASVNAVTKSGTNTFTGSAYTYQRGKGMTGTKIGDVDMSKLDNKNEQTYGFTIGGPIVKDKLFFFASAEYENDARPYTGFLPSEDGVANKKNNISRTSYADLEAMSKFLKEKYNYDTGDVRNFPNMDQKNYKILAKIDWNINDDHHLSLRYNYLNNNSWNTTNWNSGPGNNARLQPGRLSENAIAFPNSWYQNLNGIHGFAGELNSRFGNNMTNKLMVTYTATKDPQRKSPSADFPFVDILKDGGYYMSFGTELFSFHNQVINNTLSVSDDFTYTLGAHTLLGGFRYDNIYVNNSYIREGTSYYRYASMEDFMQNRKPIGFGVTYGYNGEDPKGVQMNFGLLAFYFQDEWTVTPRFKLTPGLRFEVPFYLNKLENNPLVDKLPEMRYGTKLDISTWPKSQLQVNPRVGFNWDILGDRSIQLRGGTGLFSGLMPFVWFTNQPTSSGTVQSPEMGFGAADIPDDLRFEPNFRDQQKKYPNIFPDQLKSDGEYRGAVAMVAKDFRMPQIWRSNIAADFALPGNTTLTLEALYSKDVQALLQRNVNLPEPDGKMADGRPLYSKNRMVSSVNNAIVLGNTNKGYQGSFTVQLRNRAVKGLDAMVAYTYSFAKDQTNNPGSSANSAWTSNHTYGDMNDPELSYSQFAIPHRVVGSLSYRIEYLKHMATTISLYYSGSSTGRYSYIYGNDINGDYASGDLLYVPTGTSDPKFSFVDKKGYDKRAKKEIFISAADQYEAFMKYVDGNPYLSKRKGNFAERFGALQPWLNRFDLKLMQEFYSDFGTDRRYTLQVSLDFINVGNMLNSNWGVYKTAALSSSYGNILPVEMQKANAKSGAQKGFVLTENSIEDFSKKANVWNDDLGLGSTWGMLLGVKLLF